MEPKSIFNFPVMENHDRIICKKKKNMSNAEGLQFHLIHPNPQSQYGGAETSCMYTIYMNLCGNESNVMKSTGIAD